VGDKEFGGTTTVDVEILLEAFLHITEICLFH
jgi:hypothetical protein